MIEQQIVRISVRHCARCGGNHEDLEFKKLSNPIRSASGYLLSYWAMCPLIYEPILMAVIPESGGIPEVALGDA